MNRAWTLEHAPERLADHFAEDMVAITPVDRLRREGRRACVEGWQAFVDTYRITGWQEREPRIRLLASGKAAIVTYYYDIEIVVSGDTVRQSGRDMMVLEEKDGRWWLVADQFSGFPS